MTAKLLRHCHRGYPYPPGHARGKASSKAAELARERAPCLAERAYPLGAEDNA
jgi:hypothetical protein